MRVSYVANASHSSQGSFGRRTTQLPSSRPSFRPARLRDFVPGIVGKRSAFRPFVASALRRSDWPVLAQRDTHCSMPRAWQSACHLPHAIAGTRVFTRLLAASVRCGPLQYMARHCCLSHLTCKSENIPATTDKPAAPARLKLRTGLNLTFTSKQTLPGGCEFTSIALYRPDYTVVVARSSAVSRESLKFTSQTYQIYFV